MGIIIRQQGIRETVIVSDTDHVDDYLAGKIQPGKNMKVEVLGDTYKFLRLSSLTPNPAITNKFVKLPFPTIVDQPVDEDGNPVDENGDPIVEEASDEVLAVDTTFEQAFAEEAGLNGMKLTSQPSGGLVSVYSIPIDVSTVFVDATDIHFELDLPPAGPTAGQWLVVVGVDVSNGIAVQGDLDVNATVQYNVNGESYTFASDGACWHVIGHYAPHFYY